MVDDSYPVICSQVVSSQHHVWVAVSTTETAASLSFPIPVSSFRSVRSTRAMPNLPPAGGTGANYSCVCSQSCATHLIVRPKLAFIVSLSRVFL